MITFTQRVFLSRTLTIVLLFVACRAPLAADESTTSAGRARWLTSRVVGSPDPPLPYRTEELFAEIPWNQPLYAKAEPGTESLFVVMQGGEKGRPSRVVRLVDADGKRTTQLVLEIDRRLIYGLEFHPEYDAGGELFLFTNGPTGDEERKNRVSKFRISTEPPRVRVAESEQTIMEWRSMGHDGGDLAFGRDGMLYISSGDGTTDSDSWLSAQDVRNLLGGVLRIDVSKSTPDAPYSIPSDNPYLSLSGARGELWAIGLRNPWRMSADRRTGQIWVGNNGQDLWETAHLIRRGENYGWSVYEGNHPFYLSRERGPGPIVGPTIEHHHRDFRSLTGGVVYYGSKLPELAATYVYGDYATGKIWGARHDGHRLTFHQELADTTLQIAGFAVSPSDELLVIDYGGAIHRLVKAPPATPVADFPRRLSDTGLFASTSHHQVAEGVIAYSVCAPGWMDGATSLRFLALPGDSQLEFAAKGGWNLPDGAVVVQTLSLPQVNGESPRRIETRLLTRQQGEWAGYSYLWNAAGDDAVLVGRDGLDQEVEIADAAGNAARQTWRVPSRAECLSCHSRAANFLLGISTPQLNRDGPGDSSNQLTRFQRIGLLKRPLPDAHLESPRLVDPYDRSADVDLRARSYLHVNCAGCHVRAGGGNARMEFEFTKPLDAMKLISEHPQHATLGVPQARLVTPGRPNQSVLLRRLSLRGPGQMPPLVSNRVDEEAVQLFERWIAQLPVTQPFVRAWKVADFPTDLGSPVRPDALKAGRSVYQKLGCHQCHRLAGEGGGAGPDLTGIASRLKLTEILEAIIDPSKKVAPEFAATILETSDGRILQGRIEQETESQIQLRTAESFAEPITIEVAEVDERYLSQLSIMPPGLLDVAHREEILDLLRYLMHASP